MSSWAEFSSKIWECDFRTHPVRAPLEGVLIETRDHPDIKYALSNFSCMLPWASLTIFHSPDNEARIKSIIGPETNVNFINIGRNLTRATWNAFMLRADTWSHMHGTRVLIFNVDTGIRKNDFLKFMDYAYIGSPWNHFPTGDKRVFQGNGGFSLRDPALMADIAARHGPPPDIVPDPNIFPEDVFFASHCVYRGARMPTWAEANMFSTESNEAPGVVGFHDGAKYCPKSTTLYTGHEGPSRKLVTIHEARADGHDVTDLVRLGIGAKCLRIGSGALIYPGANKLTIDGASWDLDNGHVKDEIVLLPK
jgi:hypothetical protein